ncbi:MAG: YqcI/YcgG family protein [[Pasteurella] mairii]|uniref:Uncharacterized conserved protein n=1 Tax=[Pasteurella] mairii TaxID=757 RepID=A0A379B1W4_9PAST|nr:YqcI/YcgG family protein [[Pasteurella] mairii]SUB32625.1 Uncharacterized conserved protein [[Pasteurella] mairii]
MKLLSRKDIQASHLEKWMEVCFNEFESSITNKIRLFPCIFGVKGFLKDQLRYVFMEEATPKNIAPYLKKFVNNSRQYGKYTSLVIFEKPDKIETLQVYEEKFWNILKGLSEIDELEWPQDIPTELDNPMWEFCFHGEPIFVVCTNPAHTLRQSRRSSSFMLTLQPRWVFDDILGTEEKANVSFKSVRGRLKKYDFIDLSPNLGKYGNSDNREWKQYFLDDDNRSLQQCPFHKLK